MRKVVVEVPEYHPVRGLRLLWDEGFDIEVRVDVSEVVITANREGLLSLARHLLTLAQEEVRAGAHLHLGGGQEITSDLELVLERMGD